MLLNKTKKKYTEKIISQIDNDLVSLSSKTYVFEDKLSISH